MSTQSNLIQPAVTIILGAGASFDMIPPVQEHQVVINSKYKPPLTKGLFSLDPDLEKILDNYPKAYTAIGTLRNKLVNADKTLETLLKELKESKENNKNQQFRQIPFYLQHIFDQISRYYCHHPINYTTLVSESLRESVKTIAFATLNYDLFFERALQAETGVDFSGINQYIPDDQKWMYIKLHGSVNWGRKLKKISNPGKNIRALLDCVTHLNLEFDLEENIEVIKKHPAVLQDDIDHFYPAITVPIDGKYEFNCPKDHLEKFEKVLRISNKILFIGSSIRDKDLTDLLKKNVTEVKLIGIVSGSDVEQIKYRLKENVPQLNSDLTSWQLYDKGFSEFVKGEGIESFLDF